MPYQLMLCPLFGRVFIVILSFLVALFFGWQSLSSVHFFYPQIYDVLDLATFIQHYAPLNDYRFGFENTLREQHITLFSEIVSAINQSGQGLAQIVYYDSSNQMIDTLLRPPEVVHLQDVANLLDRLRSVAYGSMLALLVVVMLFKMAKQTLGCIRHTLFMVLGGLIFMGGTIIVYDAQAIFYALHTAVFPEGHQWFFYYQESLMTTLMKAPDIFAVIAVLLVGAAFLYFVLMLWLIHLYLKWRAKPSVQEEVL